jgi:uncharacterized protein (TIGR03435 family)
MVPNFHSFYSTYFRSNTQGADRYLLRQATPLDMISAAISLPDAISKQLGLKLELQKVPVPMLVLDHIDENPTDN